MSRRSKPTRRTLALDVRYNSQVITMFVNRLMRGGKKSVALGVIYKALAVVEDRTKRPPLEIFDQALKNAAPVLEVKPRRVGGATYQVPMEVPPGRQLALAMRWIVGYAQARKNVPMMKALANELKEAAAGQGNAIKKRDDTHKMAQANRAFAHFRF